MSETEDLARLVTESRNPNTLEIDQAETEEILRLINAEDQQVPLAVAGEIPRIARAVDLIVAALTAGGRLFYAGAGTSGRLGVMDAVECLPTFRVPPEVIQGILAGGREAMFAAAEGAEDDPDLGRQDIAAHGVGAGDVVVGIAASGRSPYTVAALAEARRRGARTVAVVNNPASPLAGEAEIAIAPVVGPEVIMGSTRMKAGTAQKLVLNMLSTATFIRMGKVYSNLMVDLLPSNAKLVDRAQRIIHLATGCTNEEAAAALAAAGGEVKVAVVMVLARVAAAQARQLLQAAGGRVRQAVAMARHGRTGEGYQE